MSMLFNADFPLLFLSRAQAAEIDALTARVIPSEPESPGAREAGVVEYIDRTLAGFGRDLQGHYRDGLARLAEAVAADFGVATFAELGEDDQDAVLARLDGLGDDDPLGQFFRLVREHTVQGFFGDPAYGGNRDAVGWRLIGYPGAQWGYDAEQMRPGYDTAAIPVLTVADLYRRRGGNR